MTRLMNRILTITCLIFLAEPLAFAENPTPQKMEKKMNIVAISISGSNPSMGPNEVKSEKTLSMKGREELTKDLLENTTVNGKVTLGEYLKLHVAGNKAEIQKIRDAYKADQSDFAKGTRIYSFNVYFADGTSFKTGDLRYWKIVGEGYNNWRKVQDEHGTVHESDANSPRVPIHHDPNEDSD